MAARSALQLEQDAEAIRQIVEDKRFSVLAEYLGLRNDRLFSSCRSLDDFLKVQGMRLMLESIPSLAGMIKGAATEKKGQRRVKQVEVDGMEREAESARSGLASLRPQKPEGQ